MGDPIEFTESDRQSPLWDKMMRWTDSRITKNHVTLEHRKSHDDTEFVRGRIAELREWQSLNIEKPVVL